MNRGFPGAIARPPVKGSSTAAAPKSTPKSSSVSYMTAPSRRPSEAALRSLEDVTPEEALAMVNKILRARWKDEQLVDSGLTRSDMSKIAEIFVRVWQQFNHKRIAYPKAVLDSNSADK